MAKAEKTTPAATDGAAKPNSKKKLLFIILGVLVLVAGGGAGWYFTKGGRHAEEAKASPPAPPKFMALEPFTVNLQNDNSEQFLQVGITLKFAEPELEEKIKLHMPEIRSHLVFLLSSKRASDLAPVEGKKKLVQEIIAEANSVLGVRAAPKIVVYEDNAASAAGTPSDAVPASGAETTPAETASTESAPATDENTPPPAPARSDKQTGILDVLFTSFIIQ